MQPSTVLSPPELAALLLLSGVVAGGVWRRFRFADAASPASAGRASAAQAAGSAPAMRGPGSPLPNLPVPMWRRDAAGRLIAANDAFAAIVEAADATAAVAADAQFCQAERPALDLARGQGRPTRSVMPVIVAGQRRLYDVHLDPSDDGVTATAIDVTDREALRQELAQSERSAAEMLDRVTVGVARFDTNRRLSFANRAFVELFALDPRAAAERPSFDQLLEMMREARRLPESGDFATWRQLRRGWFEATREAVEEVWALPDSAVLRIVAQPHNAGGLLLLVEDRTEALRLRGARDALLRVQTATFDNLYEAVAVFGPDGRIQLSNRRYAELWPTLKPLLGERPHVDEVATLMRHLIQGPGELPRLGDLVRLATVGREARFGTFTLLDGRVIDYAAVPLPDGNALFAYLEVTDRVVAERALRERAEALQESDALKSTFIANVSYELRTPLTAISGFGEMLLQGYAGPLNPRQSEYLGTIVESAERLRQLVDDILDLSTTQAGKLAIQRRTIDLDALLAEVCAGMADQAEAAGIRLLPSGTSLGTLSADARRLRQALGALLTNAVRITPRGGDVSILTGQEGDELVVDLRAGGIPGEGTTLFDRFQRGRAGTGAGLGLGISLAREFVSLHGGTLSVETDSGGRERTVIRLPSAAEEPPAAIAG